MFPLKCWQYVYTAKRSTVFKVIKNFQILGNMTSLIHDFPNPYPNPVQYRIIIKKNHRSKLHLLPSFNHKLNSVIQNVWPRSDKFRSGSASLGRQTMWSGESDYALGVNGETEFLKYLMSLIRYNHVYIPVY